MSIEFTLLEMENLVMMHDHCKRWFNHEYPTTAIAKVKKARAEYIELWGKQPELFEPIPELMPRDHTTLIVDEEAA